MSGKRGLIIGLTIGFVLVVATVYFTSSERQKNLSQIRSSPRISFPEKVFLEDFQRPLDRDITEQLGAFETNGISRFIDGNILKPYFDDVVTQRLTVTGVELSTDQFPDRKDLKQIAEDCARIL